MDNRMNVQAQIKRLKDEMVGYRFRHFKGGVYVVTDLAVHSETEEPMVVYRNVNDPELVWCRPLSMFMSRVDREKYPYADQMMRFSRIGRAALEKNERRR